MKTIKTFPFYCIFFFIGNFDDWLIQLASIGWFVRQWRSWWKLSETMAALGNGDLEDVRMRRHGVEYIHLYYPHRIDAWVPIQETVTGTISQSWW